MTRIQITCFLLLSACLQVTAQDERMTEFVRDLMGRMSVDEKIGQLNLTTAGDIVTGAAVNENVQQKVRNGQIGAVLNSFSLPFIKAMQDLAVRESPNHIPILFGMDVIHGYRTIFPIPLAMACSWDLQRIEQAARIAAQEATASGICWTYSPMVDIARDPRWGRIAEGAGEDPWLGSQVAAALVRGYQGNNLALNNTMMACVKHFALYGAAEAGRDYNTVDMSRVAMYNYFLPPYKAACEAGAGSFMTSFNVVDAVPATGNKWLLTGLLRDEWGFDGFVVTDYTAINEMIMHGMGNLQEVSALAIQAGTDMDMVGEGFLTTLKKSLEAGKVSVQDIDLACKRILEAKYKLGLFDDPYRYINAERNRTDILTRENLEAARIMAARSMVLLKNDNQLLPLRKSGTVAVVGPLADSRADLLGTWAIGGNPEITASILKGIKNTCGKAVTVLYARGSELTDDPRLARSLGQAGAVIPSKTTEDLLIEAVETAKRSDVVVAVLGEAVEWSGEAASRSYIGLPANQQNLLRALLATGKPVVLVLINGRPLTVSWENDQVNSILEAWAAGTEAGNAVAGVLFGDYSPSGRLVTTFPRHEGQIPLYYNHLNTGRPMDPDNKYTSKYLDVPNDPLYPFGYGLTYTTFAYGDIYTNKQELKGNDTLMITVAVSNTGRYAGEEVVQLYIRDPVASVSRPVRELKNFRKIMLQPGESKEVTMEVTTRDLMFYNGDLEFDWEPGEFEIYVGPNSRDTRGVKVFWKK